MRPYCITETATMPVNLEWYKWTFEELTSEKGEAFALEKVQMYQELSRQYPNCTSWVIHNCRLLTTFRSPTLGAEPPAPIRMSVFYAPVTNTVKQKHLSLNQVADLIRSKAFEPQTTRLRTLSDKKENSRYKRKAFCYATFSGTFTKRAEANLIQHSGLICIDLDHLNERLHEVRARVITDPSTVMAFISPNGDGLKVIYEVEPEAFTQEQYYRAYSAHLSKLLDLNTECIDSSCKDISRACFLPYDPELYINPYFEKV